MSNEVIQLRLPASIKAAAMRLAKEDDVSLNNWILNEARLGFKYRSRKPGIIRLGPEVRTHRRHIAQQSDYTISVSFDENWKFHPHDEALGLHSGAQDEIWKFTFPPYIRKDVLAKLDQMNINAFSLYGSEESLMRTLATRTYELGTMDYLGKTHAFEQQPELKLQYDKTR